MAKGLKTGGRERGTPNKITADLRDAIMHAFEQVGGVDYLAKVAEEQPRVFCTLLGKVLPLQITGNGGGPLTLEALILESIEKRGTELSGRGDSNDPS